MCLDMYNSVIEERIRKNDHYTVRLTVPRNEYASVYDGDIHESNAYDFAKNYLYHIEDNGRLLEVHVKDHRDSHVFQIEAEVSYEGTDHADYLPHYQFTNHLE